MSGKDNFIFVGEDDGYAECKQVTSLGDTFRQPSQAKAGEVSAISLSSKQSRSFGYRTDDGPYVAGEIRNPDATAFDDYPFSAMNRVVVAHTLRQSGIDANAKIVMCSGLPLKKYYVGTKLNKDYIGRKRDNLLRNDVVAVDGTPIPKIFKHYIGCEGILAWIDLVIHRNADGILEMDRDRAESRIAIVDIGGRTTDIALIDCGELDMEKSTTIEQGMLSIKQQLSEQIHAKFNAQVNMGALNKAIESGKVKLFGDDVDVSDLIRQAKQTTLSRIEAETKRLLNNASDIDQVVFVGGTAAAASDLIDGWFRNQIIGDDPAFANARGACKNAELMFRR